MFVENKRLLSEAKLELKKSKRKDYYKILGVNKQANEDEIKKAYRKRALLHHPGTGRHPADIIQQEGAVTASKWGGGRHPADIIPQEGTVTLSRWGATPCGYHTARGRCYSIQVGGDTLWISYHERALLHHPGGSDTLRVSCWNFLTTFSP